MNEADENFNVNQKFSVMKRIKHFALSLLTVAFVMPSAMAQTRVYEVEEYTPTIYMIAVGNELQEYDPEVVRVAIIEDFVETKRHGFQQAHNPQFIFSTRNNRFSLGIGGMVNLRTSYDLKGAVGNIDFVPYDIPMHKGYANQQRVMMDASTSRLFMKAIVNSNTLGRVYVYTDMDFRGGEEFTYIPRLRSAYVNLLGFTIGRDVTTFCDLAAAPTTIDFQGPNAYNFAFNEMIRYERGFVRNHLKVGVAAEMPSVNATYGENFEPIYQRVPDGIAYVQYAWGENKSSHVRLSGVIRDMYLHNKTTGENTTQVGWGAQFSGHIEAGSWVDLYMNGVYGRGITPYIQDLSGAPYDFVYKPEKPTEIHTLPMWGWQAAAQVNIIPSTFWFTGGYSTVRLEVDNSALSENQYKRGEYIFGNLFYNVTPNFTLALEYLHGSREDVSNAHNRANRISVMAQYNF